jgi:hypothetical protein
MKSFTIIRRSLPTTVSTLQVTHRQNQHYSKRLLSTQFTIDAEPAPGSPFHLAIPVHDLNLAREFYGGLLGLKEGQLV